MLAAFGHSVWSQTISNMFFSFGVGYFGDVGGSNGQSMSNTGMVTFSSRGVVNGYFKSIGTISGSSNNFTATLVCELSNGDTVMVYGTIFARQASGSLQGLFWKPLNGRSRSIGTSSTFTVSTPATESNSTTAYGIVVQCINQTLSLGQNSISGNSGQLTFAQLQDYVAGYPTVIASSPTSITSTSAIIRGVKQVAASSSTGTQTAITVDSAGFYISTSSQVNCISTASFPTVGTRYGTSNYSPIGSSHTSEVTYTTNTSSLLPNTIYFYRAFIRTSDGKLYQSDVFEFTTCPGAPTATGATICSGATASISATGVSGGTLTWHTAATGGTQLGTGASYTTAALTNSGASNTTTTYYVQDANSSCPSTRTAVTVTVKPVTSVVNVCHSVTTCAKNSTTSLPATTNQSGGGSFVWYSNTTPSNQNGTAVGNTSSSQSIPTSVSGIFYYYYTLNDGCGTITSPVQEVVVFDNKWLGTTSNDWTVGTNWSSGTAPDVSNVTEVIVIPSASVSTFPSVSNMTIASTGAIVLEEDAQFTLTGTMTNNGKFIVNSGATFVYTATVPFASNDTGEYIFRQDAAGKSALFGGLYQPVGRYWYMGVPFEQPRSVFGTAISNVEANGPYSSKVWGWNETGGAVWSEITSQSQTLYPGVGYLVRLGGSCKNLQFNTTTMPDTVEVNKAVSRTTGANSLDGFNLVSNPFPAYIDAVSMKNASTNIGNTMWYRTYNSNNNQMVFDHFQANAPSSSIINSNAGHTSSQLQKIPPYQAFWVRVQGGNGSTGNVKIKRSMLTHESNGMHLKTTTEFKAFVRINLVQGTRSDQFVVYMDNDFTPNFDSYDGEKMFVSGMPQAYTKAGSYKLAIQSVGADKSKTPIPVSVELPSPTMYTFDFIEHHIQSGVIILEDKKLGIYVNLDLDTAYTFFSTSGTIHDRFVLHFARKVIGAADPTIVDDWAEPELGQADDVAVKNIANQLIEVSRPTEHLSQADIIVYDYTGKVVQEFYMNTSQLQFAIENGAGVYLVVVKSEGQVTSKKVLIF